MPEQTRRAAQPPAQAPLRRPAPPPPVRRNLFQSQLTRRPTPATSSAEALRLEACVDVLSDSDEIVVRDKEGEVEVEVPEGLEEDGVVDEKEEMESMSASLLSPLRAFWSFRESRMEVLMIAGDRKKLTEAVKHLRTAQGVSSDQAECTPPFHVLAFAHGRE